MSYASCGKHLPGQQFCLPRQLLRVGCEKEIFACTFVCNEDCFRGQRGLGLILTFMFGQLEGEFVDSFPCPAKKQSEFYIRVDWWDRGVWWGVVSGVNLYGVSRSYFCICP